MLHFGPCDNVQCTLVEIVDDCVLEETEQFSLRLTELPGQSNRVKVGARDSEIEITDTNGKTIRMKWLPQYVYTFQWLVWVWNLHHMLLMRMLALYKSVLLSNQRRAPLLNSSLLTSALLMTVQVHADC